VLALQCNLRRRGDPQLTMHKQPIWIIIFTIVLDTLGIGILVPVVPQLLGNPASPHYLLSGGASRGSGYIMLGFLVAMSAIMQVCSPPLVCEIPDRNGGKPILALSLLGTSFGYVLFALGIVLRDI